MKEKYICIREFTYGTFHSKLNEIYYFEVDEKNTSIFKHTTWYKLEESNSTTFPEYVLNENFELYSVHRNKKIDNFL